jgi:Salt stress response/antifungal
MANVNFFFNIALRTYRYDECFLHYSNKNFFSTMRYFGYYWCGSQNATDPQQFSTILGQLVNTLVSEAASSSKMFAAGFVNYTNFNKLYGVALCTRDLSKEDCYQCLQGCVENIPFYCDGRLGGRFYGESCNLRYQLSIFYNTSAVPNAAAPAPEPAPAPTVPAVPPPAGKTSKGNDNGKSISRRHILPDL